MTKSEKSEKRLRFERNAKLRGQKVIDRLAMLGRIADNPNNYEYSQEDIEKLFGTIREFLNKIEQRFLDTTKVNDLKEGFTIEL